MEHVEGSGTTSVTGTTADVRSCASHGLRDATNLTTFRRPSTETGIIALHLNHATTPGLSVLAVVSWDTLKFAVPNRTHLFRSGQVDGSTGRTDPDGIVEHPHRETKYRPGPNPHWPVCHQIGPRFIHVCHLICSSGNFIYSHIWWDFILGFSHRTFDSATDQRG